MSGKKATEATKQLSKFVPKKLATSTLANIKSLRIKVSKLVVTNAEDLPKVTDILSGIKTEFKKLETERKKIVQPLNNKVDEVNSTIKMFTSEYKLIEEACKNILVDFKKREDEKLLIEQKKLDAQMLKDQAKVETQHEKKMESLSIQGVDTSFIPVPVVNADDYKATGIGTQVKGNVGSASFKKVWDFQITDENLIPREYLMVDESKIRKAVKEQKENCKIAGVRVFEDYNVSAK